jgi:trigger factor
VKATKENLTPTRVKITVEVPFDELKPSVDAAYRKLGRQVRVSGFRPGKVPPRILDQRVGRGAVLDEALQDALPHFYSEAVQQEKVDVLSRPEVDVTEFADNAPLIFTAEVDVRPSVELPEYDNLEVTVDAVSVSDEDVDTQLDSLRDRFAVLKPVERPATAGDYVSIDLAATVEGKPVEGAEATGMSYEIGSGTLVRGIDEALEGVADGETKTFDTELVAGEFAGQTAEVAVTVRSIKEKELPALDDDFATTASEFDTLDELRADTRTRLERARRVEQGVQARDRALEALVDRTDVPLPESVVEGEVDARAHGLQDQLDQLQMTRDQYLEAEGRTAEDFDRELRESAEKAVKAQFVLDAVAEKEQIGVDENELTEQIVRRARRAGVSPDQYAQQVVQSGQLGMIAGEVVRGKALATVLEHATVTDTEGATVDLEALREDVPAGLVASEDADDLLDAIEDEEISAVDETAVDEAADEALAAQESGPAAD